jgi:methanogenic corrinoid protein MtbC1
VSEENIIEKLRESIISLDEEGAKKITEQIIDSGVDIKEAIDKGITEASRVIGGRFERQEYFLGELLIAEDIITDALGKLLLKLPKGVESRKSGKVVIATVYGDIHDIGKNLLSQLLKLNNFEVYDLGNNVPSIQILNKAVETKADIIVLSSLMSTTMPSQKEVIDMLKAFGWRDRFKVIIGGGSTSPEWKSEIEADGWGETAWDGVKLVGKLIGAEA